MVYYTFFIHVIQFGIPKLSLSGRVGGPCPVPSSVDPSEQNEPSGSSPSCPDWDERDWEDYNYDQHLRTNQHYAKFTNATQQCAHVLRQCQQHQPA